MEYHGGGSFKMSFQVANANNPNQKDNTVAFSLQACFGTL